MVMRLLLLFTLALVALHPASGAEADMRPSRPVVRAALVAVVDAQLEAWREQHFTGAYALAAAGIRAHFPLEAFVAMVRQGYPEIADNVRADYGSAVDNGDAAMLSVRVYPREGSPVNRRYLLVREDGVWRIAGVIGETRPLNEV